MARSFVTSLLLAAALAAQARSIDTTESTIADFSPPSTSFPPGFTLGNGFLAGPAPTTSSSSHSTSGAGFWAGPTPSTPPTSRRTTVTSITAPNGPHYGNCSADCTFAYPRLLEYSWSPISFAYSTTTRVTIATLVVYVDTIRHVTKTSTKYATIPEPIGYGYSTTKSQVIPMYPGAPDITAVVTFPTPYFDYLDSYSILHGSLATQGQCVTYNLASVVPKAHPPLPSSIAVERIPESLLTGSDRYGDFYTLVINHQDAPDLALSRQYHLAYQSLYTTEAALRKCEQMISIESGETTSSFGYSPPKYPFPGTHTNAHTSKHSTTIAASATMPSVTPTSSPPLGESTTETTAGPSTLPLTHTSVEYLTARETIHTQIPLGGNGDEGPQSQHDPTHGGSKPTSGADGHGGGHPDNGHKGHDDDGRGPSDGNGGSGDHSSGSHGGKDPGGEGQGNDGAHTDSNTDNGAGSNGDEGGQNGGSNDSGGSESGSGDNANNNNNSSSGSNSDSGSKHSIVRVSVGGTTLPITATWLGTSQNGRQTKIPVVLLDHHTITMGETERVRGTLFELTTRSTKTQTITEVVVGSKSTSAGDRKQSTVRITFPRSTTGLGDYINSGLGPVRGATGGSTSSHGMGNGQVQLINRAEVGALALFLVNVFDALV